MSKPSIIFFGTPEFAVPTLEALNNEFGVEAVVTTPDKPKGRGRKLAPPPVKIKAEELGLPVYQPESLKDEAFLEEMRRIDPDIMAVVAFRIMPEELYSIAKNGAFNIHGSLLPAYRGAAPINWAIINGETKTGLTSFMLQKKVDTGNILMQTTVDIPDGATAGDLAEILMPLSASLAADTVNLIMKGNYRSYPQDASKATPAPKIFPEHARIKWNMHARDLRNFIHGMSPVPGAWTLWNGGRLKILRTEFTACGSGEPGLFKIEGKRLLVNCLKGVLSVTELQLQGKRAMSIKDFLAGYRGEKEGKFE